MTTKPKAPELPTFKVIPPAEWIAMHRPAAREIFGHPSKYGVRASDAAALLLTACTVIEGLIKERDELQGRYDTLTGERFSDRVHVALRAKLDAANARVAELEPVLRKIANDAAGAPYCSGCKTRARNEHEIGCTCASCNEPHTLEECATGLAAAVLGDKIRIAMASPCDLCGHANKDHLPFGGECTVGDCDCSWEKNSRAEKALDQPETKKVDGDESETKEKKL